MLIRPSSPTLSLALPLALAGTLAGSTAALAAPGPAQIAGRPNTTSASPPDALVRFAPAAPALWLESTALGPVLDAGLEHPLLGFFLGLPGVQDELNNTPEEILTASDALLGGDTFEVLRGLTEGGIGVALVLGTEGPEPVVVARGAADADAFEDALEAATRALTGLRLVTPVSQQRCQELGVLEAWAVGDAQRPSLARADARTVVFASNPAHLATSLARSRAPKIPKNMTAHLQAAERSGAELFAWVDLDRFHAEAPLLDDLAALQWDPAAHLFLGPVLAHIGGASEASASMTFGADAVSAQVLATGPARKEGAVLFPPSSRRSAGGAVQRLPHSDSDWARFQLHRNVGALLEHRIDLVDARELPGLAEVVGNIGLLTGGPDAADALLGALAPDWTAVVHPFEFGDAPRPDVPLPALTIVARLEDPESNEARFLQAFQSGAALAGADRAQNGDPSVLLGVEAAGDVAIYKAAPEPPPAGEAVDLAYNVSPGCCVVDGWAILSTHHRAARAIAARMSSGATPGRPRTGDPALRSSGLQTIDHIKLDGPALTALLASNRDLLVARSVLVDGKSRDRAEADIELVLAVARGIRRVTLTTAGRVVPGRRLTASLTVELQK